MTSSHYTGGQRPSPTAWTMQRCSTDRLGFQPLGWREIRGDFDEGAITSDAGALLLREVEQRTGELKRPAAFFSDHRCPEDLLRHADGAMYQAKAFGGGFYAVFDVRLVTTPVDGAGQKLSRSSVSTVINSPRIMQVAPQMRCDCQRKWGTA